MADTRCDTKWNVVIGLLSTEPAGLSIHYQTICNILAHVNLGDLRGSPSLSRQLATTSENSAATISASNPIILVQLFNTHKYMLYLHQTTLPLNMRGH